MHSSLALAKKGRYSVGKMLRGYDLRQQLRKASLEALREMGPRGWYLNVDPATLRHPYDSSHVKNFDENRHEIRKKAD